MKRFPFALMLALSLYSRAQGGTEQVESDPPGSQADHDEQVLIQIGGRFCEYHRTDVDAALHRYPGVHRVEFLNDHGTVLVRYQNNTVAPIQLAESVERALAMGVGCKAWVDRGAPQPNSIGGTAP